MRCKFYAVTTAALLSLAGAFISPRHTRVALSSRDKIRNANTQPLYESAAPFAGSGPRQVDMNQYNLPLEIIEQEWSANVVAKTIDNEGGIFLSCKNLREYFVDHIEVEIPRPASGVGLGIGLQEIAGGREDGLGITVVSDLIEDGYVNSLDVDIMRGDSIAGILIQRSNSKDVNGGSVGLTDSRETVSISTECLGYDGTVDAILSLPDAKTDDETLVLNIRRIRRKPKITVNLKYPPSQDTPDETIELFAGENLRLGMLVRGVKLNDPLAKRFDTKSEGNCGAGGLCRTCVVNIQKGEDLLAPQKTAEKQMLADNPRWRLGCKAFVGYGMKEGEMTVQVNPNQWD